MPGRTGSRRCATQPIYYRCTLSELHPLCTVCTTIAPRVLHFSAVHYLFEICDQAINLQLQNLQSTPVLLYVRQYTLSFNLLTAGCEWHTRKQAHNGAFHVQSRSRGGVPRCDWLPWSWWPGPQHSSACQSPPLPCTVGSFRGRLQVSAVLHLDWGASSPFAIYVSEFEKRGNFMHFPKFQH